MKLITLIILTVSLSACSTLHIMKDCAGTDLENIYVCKNLKPWE